MKNVVWLIAGMGAAACLAQLAAWRQKQPSTFGAAVDLNTCTREQLLGLSGVDGELAERILDNRPYRSKFDLLNRRIIPEGVYIRVRSQVFVEPAAARKAVQIAMA